MRRALLALFALFAAPAAAQPPVVSPAPEAVSVTVYRDPRRGAYGEMELDWLQGFALISETRTVSLPAGPSVIRFEGVAGGIIPASVIVAGLPDAIGEKNRDARLISPGTLVDAALGRRVHIRRTDRATGRVTESEAIIRAGPDGVVMQTPDGIEALRCSGLPETLLFPEIPAGLSARPTLAVTTRAAAPATVTVRLSYLATGFDWQANYIASVAADGRTLDLFAWLTLANGNDESFADARTQAVAGTLSRKEDEGGSEPEPVSSTINARCWPRGTTSDIPLTQPPRPEADMQGFADEGGDIIVTGSRIPSEKLLNSLPQAFMTAEQEELGDLKLYRIPEPVTVAAHAQKQVALLSRREIPFERFYGITVSIGYEPEEPAPALVIIRTRNVAARHLGLPLPAGPVVVFEQVDGRSLVVGETSMDDAAVGQQVELMVGDSPGVLVTQRRVVEADGDADDEDGERDRSQRYELEISNANPRPVSVEVTLRVYGEYTLVRPSRKLGVRDGRHFWLARVPANGRTILSYTRKPEPRPRRDEDDEENEDD
jgi:hypothetical protein